MPRFDGTGPAGMGPMTGWGMGYCGSGRMYGGRNSLRGRRYGRGRGFGAWNGPGAAFGWNAGPAGREDQIEFLRRRSEQLEEELEETRKVIQEMEADKE